MIKMTASQAGNLLTIEVSGKLTKSDYERFAPEVEELIRNRGKLRVLVVMRDFHGWEAGALWEDIKFDIKHFSDIERLALVGDKKWEQGMAAFCKPFTTAKVRYFPTDALDNARTWVTT